MTFRYSASNVVLPLSDVNYISDHQEHVLSYCIPSFG